MTSRSQSRKAPRSSESEPRFSEPALRLPINLREREGAVDIAVHVQPRARRNEVAGFHGGSLKLRIQAPPVGGEANRSTLAFVAELLQVTRPRVTLVSGERSREKVVRIDGI